MMLVAGGRPLASRGLTARAPSPWLLLTLAAVTADITGGGGDGSY